MVYFVGDGLSGGPGDGGGGPGGGVGGGPGGRSGRLEGVSHAKIELLMQRLMSISWCF